MCRRRKTFILDSGHVEEDNMIGISEFPLSGRGRDNIKSEEYYVTKVKEFMMYMMKRMNSIELDQ